jgi:hypothetical protein
VLVVSTEKWSGLDSNNNNGTESNLLEALLDDAFVPTKGEVANRTDFLVLLLLVLLLLDDVLRLRMIDRSIDVLLRSIEDAKQQGCLCTAAVS